MTHAVRESRDATTRSVSVSTGLAGTCDDLEAFFRQAIDLPAEAVELGVGRDQARAVAQRERRQPSCHELVGVLAERNVLGAVAEQPRKPGTHARRPRPAPSPISRRRIRRHRARRAAGPRIRRPATPDASGRSAAAARRRGSANSDARAGDTQVLMRTTQRPISITRPLRSRPGWMSIPVLVTSAPLRRTTRERGCPRVPPGIFSTSETRTMTRLGKV